MALPRLKRDNSMDGVVAVATLVFAGATAGARLRAEFWLLMLAMLLAGGAWLSLLSSLNVAVQTVVPSWVRGRALSVYMLVFYAGLAGGSALWGGVAEHLGLPDALLASAAGMIVGLAATFRIHLRSGEGLNLAPSRQWPAPDRRPRPRARARAGAGRRSRYRVDPARAAEFARRHARRPPHPPARRRHAVGALRRLRRPRPPHRGLPASSPGSSTCASTSASPTPTATSREQARAFHLGPEPPEVRHLIAEPLRTLAP